MKNKYTQYVKFMDMNDKRQQKLQFHDSQMNSDFTTFFVNYVLLSYVHG